MKKNIVLIGFMGTGKTTVGLEIAKKLEMNFVDSDDEIISRVGISINEIFEKYGEEHFRKIEVQIIKELSELEGYVIATGGGVVKNEKNIHSLKKKGLIFHLKGSPEKIISNLKNETEKRPLLRCNDIKERVTSLLVERANLYNKALDFEIEIDSLSIEEIASKLISVFNKNKD